MAKPRTIVLASLCGGLVSQLQAINIVVDYSYDSNNFFDTQTKRDAMQAAADRFSRVISSELDAVGPSGTGPGGTQPNWRVGFTHPGTGNFFQLSTASNAMTDTLGGDANDYGFGGLNANEWVLFAGGRSLGFSGGQGGTGVGANFTSTLNDINGPYHRGFNDNTPANTIEDLPRWGGAITFDTATTWHFGVNTAAGSGQSDFYSIALHEVGHALGLSAGWNQWQNNGAGAYVGLGAVDAYNADNGTSLTSLDLVSTTNDHWEDGTYDSNIFEPGDPNLAGTVGLGNGQDLLLEPTFNASPSQRRIELTNVDVGALQDLGWTVIPEPSSLLLLGMGAAFSLRRRR